MALRLRYGEKSLVLPSGQLVVGRSAYCHIVVDDPQASRRHAVITMSRTGAFISDLSSQAGVVVNGQRIASARRLARGDTIHVTSLRITVEDVTPENDDEPTDPKLRATLSPPSAGGPKSFRLRPTPALGIPIQRIDTVPARDPAPETLDGEPEEDTSEALMRTQEAPRVALSVPRSPDSSPRAPLSGPRPPDSSPRDALPRAAIPPSGPRSERMETPRVSKLPPLPSFSRPDTLRALAGMGEKALALGRADEAERILQRALFDALDAARRGDLDASNAELAASLSAKLATATCAGRWFSHAVQVYAVRAEVAPAAVIDLLFAAVHKIKIIDKVLFRDYVASLRSSPSDSPARRFLLQRLEGLKRLVEMK